MAASILHLLKFGHFFYRLKCIFKILSKPHLLLEIGGETGNFNILCANCKFKLRYLLKIMIIQSFDTRTDGLR